MTGTDWLAAGIAFAIAFPLGFACDWPAELIFVLMMGLWGLFEIIIRKYKKNAEKNSFQKDLKNKPELHNKTDAENWIFNPIITYIQHNSLASPTDMFDEYENQLRSFAKQYGIDIVMIGAKNFLKQRYVFAIKYNMILDCVLDLTDDLKSSGTGIKWNNKITIGEKQFFTASLADIGSTSKEHYGYSNINVDMNIENKPIPTYKTQKNASVLGRAVAGGIVGGNAGAVVGAASALEKNLKNVQEASNEALNNAIAMAQYKPDYQTFTQHTSTSFSRYFHDQGKELSFTAGNDCMKPEFKERLEEAIQYDAIQIGDLYTDYLINQNGYSDKDWQFAVLACKTYPSNPLCKKICMDALDVLDNNPKMSSEIKQVKDAMLQLTYNQ